MYNHKIFADYYNDNNILILFIVTTYEYYTIGHLFFTQYFMSKRFQNITIY